MASGMKLLKKKIVVIVEKTNTGFSAYPPDYPAGTTGQTYTELKSNMLEALNLYFEDKGYKLKANNLALRVDFKQLFQYYKVINAKFLAERIDMNPALLSQYVQGRKQPSQKHSEMILNGIQQIGRELAELRLLSN
jgi:predicted RNase H-like HicB family nuclease